MEVNNSIKPNLRIKAFYLFFIIVNIQTGVGILGAPRFIYQESKQDAWISVLISGLIMHCVVLVMIIILKKYKSADIFGIQVDIFGKWLGTLLGTLYLVYFFATLLSGIINYIQIVQVFIYPQMKPWILGMIIIALLIYAVLGGFRVAVGVMFVYFFVSFWLFLFLFDPARLIDFNHFKPVLEATPKELLLGSFQAGYSFIGLEILLFIYPFIDNKDKIALPVHLGTAMTTMLLFLVTFLSIGYFSDTALTTMLWPVLTLYKIIEYPFIERFDLIVIVQWLMVILPNFVLFMWVITYGVKRLYGASQRKTLYVIGFLLIIGIIFIKKQLLISQINAIISNVGFVIAIIYPFFLMPFVLVKSLLKNRRIKHKKEQSK